MKTTQRVIDNVTEAALALPAGDRGDVAVRLQRAANSIVGSLWGESGGVEGHNEVYSVLESQEFVDALCTFCQKSDSSAFELDQLREHLEQDGINLLGVEDDALEAGLYDAAPEVISYLRENHDSSVYFLKLTPEEAGTEDLEDAPAQYVFARVKKSPPGDAAVVTDVRAMTGGDTEGNSPVKESAENKDLRKTIDTRVREAIGQYLESKEENVVPRKDILDHLVRLAGGDPSNREKLDGVVTGLKEQGVVFGYRSDGVSWITLDPKFARAQRIQQKEKLRGDPSGESDRAGELTDETQIALYAGMLRVFLQPGRHVQQLHTWRGVWREMNGGDDNVSMDNKAKRLINRAARELERLGLVLAEQRSNRGGPMSKSASDKVMMIGLASQAVKEKLQRVITEGDATAMTEYLQGLIEEQRVTQKSKQP